MRRGTFAVLATAALGVALALAPGAMAGNGNGPGVRNVGPNYNHGKKLGISKEESEPAHRVPKDVAHVGDVRTMVALDDYRNRIYLKNYTLRGVGQHIEVWVANNLAFPDHNGVPDCRNALGLATVTDAQVQNFISEFDSNIYPKESEAFSVPPRLDGKDAPLNSILGTDANYFHGQSDNIVVLIDNVRDANYYAPDTPDGQTYIAGFFYSTFNYYLDRNVMTIDAYDWLHRTGANPPDSSADPAYQACPYTSGKPRPHLYEGTFAHEYQHLLESYSDPDEYSWVNEGLSDWAQTLVGYVNPANPQNVSPGADSHLSCFEGWQPPQFGGPENSLTVWGDQGGPEILCDYGAAYSIMQMLATRYGDAFMSALHRAPGNGLQGLNDVLASFVTGKTATQVVHEWAALMALDNQAGSSLTGGSTADYTSAGLWSTINWANTQAYDSPGAPPNGSDYVPLGPVAGLSSIEFQGSSSLPAKPVQWTSVTNAPGHADAALYSGAANNRDEAIVRSVTLGSTLTFDALWSEEDGWDFGFVQVSTDGGATYTSLACTDTTTTTDPGALPTAKQNVPGFSGYSGGWKAESCNTGAYAGHTVLLSFRAFNDPGTLGGAGAPAGTPAGFWVDNVASGGTAISDGSDLAAWQSPTQVHPTAVNGYTVQLVAYDGSGHAWYYNLPIGSSFHGSMNAAQIASALGTSATTVGAIVMFDEPTESITDYASYSLKVNGSELPGGH